MGSLNELISVIVPAYGVEEYIGKCLESIIKQTYRDIEIIVVDDGSKDKSGQIAEEYAKKDSRIVVLHKDNGGLSDARNYGIKRATGKYITCIDSDDYVDDDYIEYMYDIIKKYDTKISFCQHRVVFPSKKVEERGHLGDEVLSTEKCIERILYDDILNTSAWAKLYVSSLFDIVEYPKGMLYEDIGTTYKLLMQCDKIGIGYESKYNYVLRKTSIVYGVFNPKKLDLLTMTDIMGKDVESKYPNLEKAVLRRRVYARFSTLNQMLYIDGYDDDKKNIIDFITENRLNVLKNRKAPKRDKIAIMLLGISFKLYRAVWINRQKELEIQEEVKPKT